MTIRELDAQLLAEFFRGGCAFLTANKEYVNSLNVFPVPDGDTGTNMGLTITSAASSLEGKKTAAEVAAKLANGALMGARGNSGVILSQICRGFSQGAAEKQVINTVDFAAALQKGVDLAYRTVMKPVEGTILTVGRKMAERAVEKAPETDDIIVLLKEILDAGQIALDNTPNQLPMLKDAGVVDAGGQGLMFIFEGGLRVLQGETLEISEEELAKMASKTKASFSLDAPKGNLKYNYCTEFMIETKNADIDALRAFLSERGDSIVVVGTEELVKVHVHNKNPGEILQYALSLGALHDIKIDNMNDQHRESDFEREGEEAAIPTMQETAPAEPQTKCGVVAVGSGEGITDLFTSLGVGYVVSGGQSMNPSAEDILNAVNAVASEEVVVMPNNSNIIMAAQQAAALSEKPVQVLTTKYIPQGLTAMLGFNPEATAEENAQAMQEYADGVKSGQVTYAVRDSSADGKEIKEGDILGIAGKQIVEVGQDIAAVTAGVIANMLEDTDSIITLLYGAEVEEADAEALAEFLRAQYSDKDIEVQFGGQELYYYLLACE